MIQGIGRQSSDVQNATVTSVCLGVDYDDGNKLDSGGSVPVVHGYGGSNLQLGIKTKEDRGKMQQLTAVLLSCSGKPEVARMLRIDGGKQRTSLMKMGAGVGVAAPWFTPACVDDVDNTDDTPGHRLVARDCFWARR